MPVSTVFKSPFNKSHIESVKTKQNQTKKISRTPFEGMIQKKTMNNQ